MTEKRQLTIVPAQPGWFVSPGYEDELIFEPVIAWEIETDAHADHTVRAISPNGSVDRDWSEVLKRPDGKFMLNGWVYAIEPHALAICQKLAARAEEQNATAAKERAQATKLERQPHD